MITERDRLLNLLLDRLLPDRAPITCRCSFCDFTTAAALEEAHAAFQAHVCGRARPTVPKRRNGFALRP